MTQDRKEKGDGDTLDPRQTPYFRSFVICVLSAAIYTMKTTTGSNEVELDQRHEIEISTNRLFIRMATAAVFVFMLYIAYTRSKNPICDEFTKRRVVLAGPRIFSTFTVQNWSALTILFTLEALADGLMHMHSENMQAFGKFLDSKLEGVHNVLTTWAVFITAVCAGISLFLLLADGNNPIIRQRRAIFFGFRGLIMHNLNAIAAVVSHISGGRKFSLHNVSYGLAWGIFYMLFSLWWYHKYGIFYYSFVSPQRAICVPGILAMFTCYMYIGRWLETWDAALV